MGRLSPQWMWKGVFVLVCVSISTVVVQYAVVGGRYNLVFSTVKHDLRLHFANRQFTGHVGITEETVYRTRRFSPANLSATNETPPNGHMLPIKDDIFLDWNEESKETLAVFVLSVISANTTLPGYKHILQLNAWEALKHRRFVFKCCVLWNNDKKTQVLMPNRTYWKMSILAAVQYSCPIRGSSQDVRGVAMEFNRKRCPVDGSRYLKPFIPKQQKPRSFAICAKIVYGTVDYKLLIDWVEYYRELKVDKILMFVYKINGTAMHVLRHYSTEGFLEIRRFNFPWKNGHLARDVGVKNSKAWQDEQVVVFDCYERLRGYSYIAIVDLDEFILPRRHSNLKDAMSMLTMRYPQSAGFTLKSYLFIKDWGRTETNNGSAIGQYYQRTPAVLTRYKNVLLPPRVRDGSVSTHEFTPKPGFNRTVVPEQLVVLHHYRYCYSNLREMCAGGSRTVDRGIDRVTRRTRARTARLARRFADV